MRDYRIVFTFFDGTTTERIYHGTERGARLYAAAEGDPERMHGAGRRARPIVINATVTPCQPKEEKRQ